MLIQEAKDEVSRVWRKCKWQNLEAEHQLGAYKDDQVRLRLRVDLLELQEMWRCRLEVI
jgi:hypothetical protein